MKKQSKGMILMSCSINGYVSQQVNKGGNNRGGEEYKTGGYLSTSKNCTARSSQSYFNIFTAIFTLDFFQKNNYP